MVRPTSNPGLAAGYRSGLEEKIGSELTSQGVVFRFEAKQDVIVYNKPARDSKYTPDFVLPNGVIIETKGRFVTEDRKKHLLIKAQHPAKDIRFVFSRSLSRISKKSPTTYAMWCDKHGFMFADKSIPLSWIKERARAA